MGGAIVVLFLLPWLDRNPVRSIRYRGGIYKKALALFVISFLVLGYLGTQPATPVMTNIARVFTAIYFGFFLLMPLYTRWEKTKPIPERVTMDLSFEEQIPALIETFEEITELKPIEPPTSEDDGHHHPAFRSVFFSRRPNPEGIRNVTSRLAKKIKESLD
jgi:ubiquinol-cytochrome c reductase cytochrome b subunit